MGHLALSLDRVLLTRILSAKMTKKQAEMVLTALVARGWLNKSKCVPCAVRSGHAFSG